MPASHVGVPGFEAHLCFYTSSFLVELAMLAQIVEFLLVFEADPD